MKHPKYLKVRAGVRYWEDTTVGGVEDTNGNIACRDGEYWCPTIDIETGIISNWDNYFEANVHYKVCDDGIYTLIYDDGITTKKFDGYVPDCLSPKENGYGDYIIMDIDKNGKIDKWKFDLDDFLEGFN